MKSENVLSPKLRHDKGVAGLTIILSAVVILFIIGFLVFIFLIIGSGLQQSSRLETPGATTNESGWINSSGYQLGNGSLQGFRGLVINLTINGTNGNQVIQPGNYTVTDKGFVTNASAAVWSSAKFTYTFTWDQNTSATAVISSTSTSLSSVTSWFPIIVTISVMVTLIMLVVLIIVAIRSSGVLGGGE